MSAPRRRSDGVATRRRILDATIALLAERGTTGTGLNQVAAASGVSYGSVYNQFRNGKDELVSEAITIAGSDIGAALEAVFAHSATLAEATATMFHYGAALLTSSDFASGCPVGTAIGDGHRSEAIRDAAVTSFDTWEALIATRAQELGVDEQAGTRFASLAVSLYEGSLLISKARRSTAPIDQARELAVMLSQEAIG
ncbi:MAG: TetR/AcrR family transcriptional regulator [Ilumatobacter sp.]